MKNLTLVCALVLSGCGAGADSSICKAIVDAIEPENSSEYLVATNDPSWTRIRAEACVHRQAYFLANSGDPAETVAKAVVEICSGPIAETAILNANEQAAKGFVSEDNRLVRANEITANYEKFGLAKVVEGRAGKCKARAV